MPAIIISTYCFLFLNNRDHGLWTQINSNRLHVELEDVVSLLEKQNGVKATTESNGVRCLEFKRQLSESELEDDIDINRDDLDPCTFDIGLVQFKVIAYPEDVDPFDAFGNIFRTRASS